MGSQKIKDISKDDLTINLPADGKWSLDIVNLSAVVRIADATEIMARASEAMAKNYTDLMADRDFYKRRYLNTTAELETARRQAASYKGKYNKAKKEIQNLKTTPNEQSGNSPEE